MCKNWIEINVLKKEVKYLEIIVKDYGVKYSFDFKICSFE